MPSPRDERRLRLFNTVTPGEAGLTPAISELDLQGPGLTGHELRQFWARVFAERTSTLASTFDQRVLAAWRIVLYQARLRGAIQAGEGVEAAMDGPDIFYRPFTAFADFRDGRIRTILEECPLPLLPPKIPSRWLKETGEVLKSYAPRKDRPLVLFRETVEHVGYLLGLHECEATRLGFEWLAKCDTVRAAFPRLDELLRFERQLASRAMAEMMAEDYQTAFNNIQRAYGLSHDETIVVMKLGRKQAHEFVDPDDLKGIRALVLLRLQKLGRQCEEALDYRGAAMVEREMWRVARDQSAQTDEDELEDMAAVVRVTAETRRRKDPPALSD